MNDTIIRDIKQELTDILYINSIIDIPYNITDNMLNDIAIAISKDLDNYLNITEKGYTETMKYINKLYNEIIEGRS